MGEEALSLLEQKWGGFFSPQRKNLHCLRHPDVFRARSFLRSRLFVRCRLVGLGLLRVRFDVGAFALRARHVDVGIVSGDHARHGRHAHGREMADASVLQCGRRGSVAFFPTSNKKGSGEETAPEERGTGVGGGSCSSVLHVELYPPGGSNST